MRRATEGLGMKKEEVQQLHALVNKGREAARTRLHAQILLQADVEGGGWTNEASDHALDVHPTTVANVRQWFLDGQSLGLRKNQYNLTIICLIRHKRKIFYSSLFPNPLLQHFC